MKSETLIKIAKKKFKSKRESIIFFKDDEKQNKFLTDIENIPHAFVLACIMDKQIKAERAWQIPYKVYKELGSFDIDFLSNVPKDKYIEIFEKGNYHRFNEQEAINFYEAIQKIKTEYDGDASNIWKGNLSSATVVYRFLEFEGVGIKIATMATNILARQFKVKFKDYYSIDISPDVHVKRVLKRMGYLNSDPTPELVIYKAREIYPKYPGLIDYCCWDIGRNYCHEINPNCDNCPLRKDCDRKYIEGE